MPEKTVQQQETRPEADARMLDREIEARVRLQVYQSMRELREFIERGGK